MTCSNCGCALKQQGSRLVDDQGRAGCGKTNGRGWWKPHRPKN